jgi:hypothetical protein
VLSRSLSLTHSARPQNPKKELGAYNRIVHINRLIVALSVLVILGSIVSAVSRVQALDQEYQGDEQNPGGHVEHGYASSEDLETSIDPARVIELITAVVVVLGAAAIFYKRQRTPG